MKLKNLFAITAIASALVLTGCKEEKKADRILVSGKFICRQEGNRSYSAVLIKISLFFHVFSVS